MAAKVHLLHRQKLQRTLFMSHHSYRGQSSHVTYPPACATVVAATRSTTGNTASNCNLLGRQLVFHNQSPLLILTQEYHFWPL